MEATKDINRIKVVLVERNEPTNGWQTIKERPGNGFQMVQTHHNRD